MKQRIVKRLGNRGVALAMLGMLWIFTAIGIAVSPLKRSTLLDERLPVWVRVCLWGIPGLLALVASIRQKYDATAWGLLMVPVSVRFASFLIGWLASLALDVTGWPPLVEWSYPDGWRGATTIAIFVVFIRVCAAGLDRLPPALRPEA